MKYQQTSLLVGFLIWLLATIVFRVAGQYFFLTEQSTTMIIMYLLLVLTLPPVAILVYKKYQLNAEQRIVSSAYMVISGMLLDVFCIQFFAWVFPNLPQSAAASFGAWLMWAYALVLLTGILWGRFKLFS